MDRNSQIWTFLLHSMISIAGIAIFWTLFSYFSASMNRFSRMKRKFNVSILPNANGEIKPVSRMASVILQMDFLGIIGIDLLNLDTIETQLVESRLGDLKGNRVKGLLLYIDSPGGSAKDCDAIYRRLKAFKKKNNIPIYAYVDGLCASGGFLVACAADKILTSPSSIVGSVGVRLMMPFFNVHKVLERWDIDVRTFAKGKYKDHLNPFRPWQEEEDADLKAILSSFYQRFVDIVVQERPGLSKSKLIDEYGARIYSAVEAENLKFIDDGASDYSNALSMLVQAVGIQKEEPYQVVKLVKKQTWLRELMEKSPIFTGKLQHEYQIETPFHCQQVAYLFFL